MIFDRIREDWEQPGWTVAEHTNSPGFPWSTADLIAVHYTAMPVMPDDTAQVLANIQRDYAQNRGYSIGYSVAVDQAGVSWELRGVDYRAAANRGMNARTFVILCLVDGADPANPAMVAKVRDLVAQFRAESPLPGNIVGHRDIGATACPGDGLYGQVTGDVFEPQTTEDDMKVLPIPARLYDSREDGHEVMGPGEVRIIPVGSHDAVFVNLTATETINPGYLTAWGDGPRPGVSNLNWDASDVTIGNTSWVPVADGGFIHIYNRSGSHVIVDLQAVVG